MVGEKREIEKKTDGRNGRKKKGKKWDVHSYKILECH